MIPPIANLAVKIGGMDRPDERKVHAAETPRLGGIAIFSAFFLAVMLYCPIDARVKGFLVGGLIIFLTGLLDDLIKLQPRHKLVGEIVAAASAVFVGGLTVPSLGNLFGTGNIELGILAVPFTLFAVVGVINAINLLDGLDGLAGGVTAIACVSFGILAFRAGNPILIAFAAALLGALVGFLNFNTYPARIFMGDSGSLFLGYCMGFFSVMLVAEGGGAISPVIPFVILGVPILDTLVVIMTRLKKRQQIFAPDKRHIHHRLLDLGIGHKFTVIFVYGLTYLLNAIAIIGYRFADCQLAAILIGFAVSFYALVHFFLKNNAAERLRFLRSNQPLRETEFYRTLVRRSSLLILLMKNLLILILVLAVALPPVENREMALMSGLLILLTASLALTRLSWGNLFLQVVLYISGAFVIFIMENYGRFTELFGVPITVVSNYLFVLLFAAEGGKIFLRRKTKQLISTPFEYFIFFIVISVALMPMEFTAQYHLLTVAGKSVILFVAYKLILMGQTLRNRKIILATTAALTVLVLRYAGVY